jgi:DHA1 family bicyclomycin/chloramphenicol resistance-like MFS transporter
MPLQASIREKKPEPKHGWRVLAILSTLMGFASISTDLFLPAIPTMATALRADVGTVELTISSYLIGFSLGQLVWGPISDRYGRRGPVAAGLILFLIGSAGCALSGSATALMAGVSSRHSAPAPASCWPGRWCAIST